MSTLRALSAGAAAAAGQASQMIEVGTVMPSAADIAREMPASADVILIEEDGHWSAQCLQFDIGAEAETLRDVLVEIQRSFIAYIALCLEQRTIPFGEKNPGPAPRHYWSLYDKRNKKAPLEVPPAPALRFGSATLDVPRLRCYAV